MGKSARIKRRKRSSPERRPQVAVPPTHELISAGPVAERAPELPQQKFINFKVITWTMTCFCTLGIVLGAPGGEAPVLLGLGAMVLFVTIIWDFQNSAKAGDGKLSIHNVYRVFLNSRTRILVSNRTFFGAWLVLLGAFFAIKYSASLANAWASWIPPHDRSVGALVVSVVAGELAIMAIVAWVWSRRLPKRPSARLCYRNTTEGVGDLAWTLTMMAIAFGVAGSTSNQWWLVMAGVLVPVLINLRRQGYANPSADDTTGRIRKRSRESKASPALREDAG